MASIVRKRSRNYMWRTWLSCPRMTLYRGVDYFVQQSSFISQLRNAASRLGKSIHVEDSGNHVVIEVLGDKRDKG